MKKLDMRDLSVEQFEEAMKPVVDKVVDLLEEHCESPREALGVIITSAVALVLSNPDDKQKAELFGHCEKAFRICKEQHTDPKPSDS